MNREKIRKVIQEFVPHKWFDIIPDMTDAIMEALEEKKPVEWEQRLWGRFWANRICSEDGWGVVIKHDDLKHFIRQEFKAMAKEIIEKAEQCARANCDEIFKARMERFVNEALKRRGVE